MNQTTLARSDDNLVWIDLEMTGLKPESDSIIEIATVVTDKELVVIADGPVFAIHQSEGVLALMDDWNQKQHGSSGLAARVRASTITEAEAEARTIEFLTPLVKAGASPMCGNSICQDRRFMARARSRAVAVDSADVEKRSPPDRAIHEQAEGDEGDDPEDAEEPTQPVDPAGLGTPQPGQPLGNPGDRHGEAHALAEE